MNKIEEVSYYKTYDKITKVKSKANNDKYVLDSNNDKIIGNNLIITMFYGD